MDDDTPNPEEVKFRRFFDEVLVLKLEDLKLRRRRHRLMVFVGTGLMALVCALLVRYCGLLPLHAEMYRRFAWIFIGCLCFVCMVLVLIQVHITGKKRLKQAVMEEIANFIMPGMRYEGDKAVPVKVFLESRIPIRCDVYKGEDYFSGTSGKTDFAFSEIRLFKEHRGKNTSYTILFHGLFFVAGFNKKLNGFTLVVPRNFKPYEGWFLELLRIFRLWSRKAPGEDVLLEDAEFMERFRVYASDQTEARYVLSPALMRRMLALREKYNCDIFFTCVDDRLHIAIHDERDYFPMPALLLGRLDVDKCLRYYWEVVLCLEIIEDMDLNVRIWGD